jgi:hypothetical protein
VDDFVALAAKDRQALKIYNLKTQAWSDLVSRTIVNWARIPGTAQA